MSPFEESLYDYTSALLQGLCRNPFQLGHRVGENGEIFMRAKVDPADYDELAYSDAYPGIRGVLGRWGAIRPQPNGRPCQVSFNLYDPRTDGIEFRAPTTPDPSIGPVAARGPAPAAPPRRRTGQTGRPR